MDDETIKAYDAFADDFCKRYREGQRIPIDRVCKAFAGFEHILEVGTGSGVDAVRFIEAGFKVTGLEPSLGLIASTLQHFPQLLGSIHHGSLPLSDTLCEQWNKHFDAVFCSAVLMHIPGEKRLQCMDHLAQVLRPGGRLFLSISETRDGLDANSRDEFGRLYQAIPEEEVLMLTAAHALSLIQKWEDDDQWHRGGLCWKSFLFEK